jgi:hypothetical protein
MARIQLPPRARSVDRTLSPVAVSNRRSHATNPDKAALADLIGTINSSLRNHDGKGVQRTNEGSPARWRLLAA